MQGGRQLVGHLPLRFFCAFWVCAAPSAGVPLLLCTRLFNFGIASAANSISDTPRQCSWIHGHNTKLAANQLEGKRASTKLPSSFFNWTRIRPWKVQSRIWSLGYIFFWNNNPFNFAILRIFQLLLEPTDGEFAANMCLLYMGNAKLQGKLNKNRHVQRGYQAAQDIHVD